MEFKTNAKGGWVIPSDTEMGTISLPDFSEAGSNCKFGSGSKFGSYSKFGSGSEFDSGSKFGFGCIIENAIMEKCFQIQNLDGSGRMINIIKHQEGFRIRAGCFIGTLDDFCNKAESEGKFDYAKGVKAICMALA